MKKPAMKKRKASVIKIGKGKVDLHDWVLPELEEAVLEFPLEKVVVAACREILEYGAENDSYIEVTQKLNPEYPLLVELEIPLGDSYCTGPRITYDFGEAVYGFLDNCSFKGKELKRLKEIRQGLHGLITAIDRELEEAKKLD